MRYTNLLTYLLTENDRQTDRQTETYYEVDNDTENDSGTNDAVHAFQRRVWQRIVDDKQLSTMTSNHLGLHQLNTAHHYS